jgi:hypothetical protein
MQEIEDTEAEWFVKFDGNDEVMVQCI